MTMNLSISPHGRLFVETAPDSKEAAAKRIIEAFADSSSRGILHLSTTELQASLPADFSFARDLGRAYLTQLCHTPEIAGQAEFPPVSPPTEGDLAAMVLSAPPMRGLEYLNSGLLKEWGEGVDTFVRKVVQSALRYIGAKGSASVRPRRAGIPSRTESTVADGREGVVSLGGKQARS